MRRFGRNPLTQRNKSPIERHEYADAALRASFPVAENGQNFYLFQMFWGIDKIPRRGANRGNKRLFGLTYH